MSVATGIEEWPTDVSTLKGMRRESRSAGDEVKDFTSGETQGIAVRVSPSGDLLSLKGDIGITLEVMRSLPGLLEHLLSNALTKIVLERCIQ